MRHETLHTRCAALALCLAAAGWAASASAQEPEVIRATEAPMLRGRVLTAQERHPVARIRINFAPGVSTFTDAEGGFEVRGLQPGDHTVTLVTPACRVVTASFHLGQDRSQALELVLPDAMARMDLGPDFEEGQGKLVTADEISRMRARTLTDVIRRVAPEMVDATPNQPGEAARLKGRNTATAGGFVEPVVVLDGLPQVGAAQLLRDIRPDEVAAVQVMSGASGGWMYGTSGGMIRIWTKRGRGGGAVGVPGSCPEYSGSGAVAR